MDRQALLKQTYEIANRYLDGVGHRRVGSTADFADLLASLNGPLPETGEDPRSVIQQLAERADPGLVATAGPRFFGFVVGGALPAAVAADWLAAAWDQNAFSYSLSPAAAVVEETARRWLTELLGLSGEMSLGLTTGGMMANFTALAAARHALYARAGWNVEERGLLGAPELAVVTSDESHITIFASLQLLGLGRGRVTRIPTDGEGRMRADELKATLARLHGPVLVCAQAGNVNTGAFDPVAEIATHVHAAGGWLHVDAAFGGWAAASPQHRSLTNGIDRADSVSVDGHKWLNVPQDCGFAFVRDRAAHDAAMTAHASYYGPMGESVRENHRWVPEASRRARGFAVYAALRSLGRAGVAELVGRCCRLARRMADRLSADPRTEILNDVVLNQVLVRFTSPDGADADAFTASVIERVQQDGTCWLGGTSWHGMHAMRVSISNWSTTERDIDISADAILRCSGASAAVETISPHSQ